MIASGRLMLMKSSSGMHEQVRLMGAIGRREAPTGKVCRSQPVR
jgi:hypothetical protein